MQKEFNHNSFKKAVSNVSGFLKEKDVNINHITLLNALSLFLGAKNWNTLKGELDKPKENTHSISLNNNDVENILKNSRNTLDNTNKKAVKNDDVASLFFDERVKKISQNIVKPRPSGRGYKIKKDVTNELLRRI